MIEPAITIALAIASLVERILTGPDNDEKKHLLEAIERARAANESKQMAADLAKELEDIP